MSKGIGEATVHSGSWKRRIAGELLGADNAFALAARVSDVRSGRTGVRAWYERTSTPTGRQNWKNIRRFRNIHAGGRCIIIGNGPSLRDTNLGILRDELTFGLNRINLMFDQLGWETTFRVVVNQLVVQQCAEDFRSVSNPLFTTSRNRRYLEGVQSAVYLQDLAGPSFSPNLNRGIWEGATVTYVAMQIAYYMGFAEVILVGVDHRFAVSGPAGKIVESAGPDHSHFDPNYFGKGFKWQLPDLETSEIAYSLAHRKFLADGRRIIDATVDGDLTVFPKLSLESALAR